MPFYGPPILPSLSQWKFCRNNLGGNSTSPQTSLCLMITMVKLVIFMNIHRLPKAPTTKIQSMLQKKRTPSAMLTWGEMHLVPFPMEAHTMCGTTTTTQPPRTPRHPINHAAMPIKLLHRSGVLKPHLPLSKVTYILWKTL
jgi:hypothetical protein